MHTSRRSTLTVLATLSLALLATIAAAASDGEIHADLVSDSSRSPTLLVPTADAPHSPDADSLDLAASNWGGPVSALATSIDVRTVSSCGACTSAQGSCTSQAQCNTYCQALVGEGGFCMTTGCNCCVCPDALPDPGDGEDFPDICQPVCRCGDGVSGPQGVCEPGCRQVNCL